jgi:hypothetical protein
MFIVDRLAPLEVALFECLVFHFAIFQGFSYSYSALAVLVLVLEETASSTSTSTISLSTSTRDAKTAQLQKALADSGTTAVRSIMFIVDRLAPQAHFMAWAFWSATC